ncbi:GGDEF domain-containing response regulator [Kamptonema formosum]|uniref:GGDEF domain-containing response regulator n=1 Tax=Kamptonema formosum TaxID=331992 RepID=UPI00034DCB5E|nr:PleD family two-component system response regulator [Oscillatoria sp. PCC 10802]
MSKSPVEPPKGNILVVDDMPDNLRVLSSMLTRRGHTVRKALNGQMALTACQTVLPDLILLDINMPDMNGYDVCALLKTSEKTCHIPVIFISVLDEALDKVKAFRVGGADYITKPFQIEEVLARVENQLMVRRLQISLQDRNRLLKDQNALLLQEIEKRRRAEEALQKANEKLQLLADSDSLTGIANRRHFDESLRREWKRSARDTLSLSLIMCDIDCFKFYNDTYGHQAGDDCLKLVAGAIGRALKRPADLVARYGGEEFAALLPNTDLDGALRVAESIHLEVRQLKIVHAQSSVSDYITLSAGIACTVPNYTESPATLISAADRALYQAKERGRNQSCAVALDCSALPETGEEGERKH